MVIAAFLLAVVLLRPDETLFKNRGTAIRVEPDGGQFPSSNARWSYPVKGPEALVTCCYGFRPFDGSEEPHAGVDLRAFTGTPLMAVSDGVVATAGPSPGFGNAVILRHDGGWETTYGHLSKVLTSAGRRVARGQIIGLSGNEGTSRGPHLHFEVRRNGMLMNPLPLLLCTDRDVTHQCEGVTPVCP